MPRGSGLLEVRTAQPDAVVAIDGRDIGDGNLVQAVLKPGTYNVRARWRGREVELQVNVRPDRRTRVSLEQVWTR